MTRLYARGPGGRRIHEATPGGHWKIMTILGAMSLSGMVATMTIEEPTDTDIFLAYVEHLLYPVLKPGDVVVMDNLSAHRHCSVPMDRKSRRGAALSAALFSRSEPHREGLGKTQTTASRSPGSNQRNSRSGHQSPAMAYSRQCPGFVQTRTRWSTIKQKML